MNPKIQNVPVPPPPQARVWTPLDLINWTKAYFEKKGIAQPRYEAELLLADVLGWKRIRLYTDFDKPVGIEHLAVFRDQVKRRGETREPLQYIQGHTQFIELKLKVSPAALIPRPETELLAVWTAERAAEAGTAPDVLDLCTGTGCIALHVASKIPGARVVATDVSKDALALAQENARALTLDTRVNFLEGDLFNALAAQRDTAAFDVIVANPPYIEESARATLQPEVRDYEPPLALFAGADGLAILRRILHDCGAWLKPGGWLGLEFGAGQSAAVLKIAEDVCKFSELKIQPDGAQIPRFLFGRKRS